MRALNKESSTLLIIDVQEKLFPLMDHPCEVLQKLILLTQGAQILSVPISVTEQYPKGLGKTVPDLNNLLKPQFTPIEKTTFSAWGSVKDHITSQVVVTGIEAHVCVLQTVRDLIQRGHEVVVANDAISSRSVLDFSTAIAEMRDFGARISSTETILFEWLEDAASPHFRAMSQLVKAC